MDVVLSEMIDYFEFELLCLNAIFYLFFLQESVIELR